MNKTCPDFSELANFLRFISAHGLRVTQFGEGFHVEAIIRLRVVAFRCADICTVGQRISCQQTYAGIVRALGKVVTDFEPVFAPTQLARSLSRKIAGKSKKDLGSKCLK